jgi:hypothetical protein
MSPEPLAPSVFSMASTAGADSTCKGETSIVKSSSVSSYTPASNVMPIYVLSRDFGVRAMICTDADI